jgi:hypothetical protein
VIDSKLVPDSPALDDGTTIQTQVVPNPSNVGILTEAPSSPVSVETNLVANALSPALGGGLGFGSAGTGLPTESAGTSSWDKFVNNWLPIIQFGLQTASTIQAQQRTVMPAPLMPTRPLVSPPKKFPGAPPTQKLSSPKTPPSQGPVPPAQNCSGGICCDPPSVPNPAAVACLNSLTPGCDHPNGPESWLAFCISK